MKKNKKFYIKPKKIIFLILIICIIGININTFGIVLTNSNKTSNNINIAQTQEENKNFIRVADQSTVDSYKKSINVQGSRYNGRVWTDKSVYANNGNGQVTLDNKFNINYDDDFLTVFSALGSSQSVEKMVASDVSIMIDVSGSMAIDVVDGIEHSEEDKSTRIAHSRIQATVTAVNNIIDTLMEANKKNRICIIAYGGTAYTLMELGHYTKAKNKNEYITVEDFMSYSEKRYQSSGSAAYTIHVKAIKDGVDYERSIRNNYTESIPEEKIKNVNACIGYHTNMQAGIYQGFKEMCDNIEKDNTIIHFPTAIIMTDGGSNYALKNDGSITGDEWYNVPIQENLSNYDSVYKKYRTETNEESSGGKETMLDILMTVSYMKAKVQKKYEEQLKQFNIKQDTMDFKIHTISVDTEEMLNSENTKWQVPRIYTTLDPKNYFKQDLSEVNWDFKQESIESYKLWQEWQTSSIGVTSTFDDSSDDTINFKINKLKDDNEITNEDVIENINYNDSFRSITSDKVSISFKEIIATTAFKPIGDSKNEVNEINALSYVDPIGKYMEIKEIKKLLLFGKEYNIIKDGEPIIENNNESNISKQYYKAVDSNNEDLEIINSSYANQTKFKLSDIKIWKEMNNDTNEKDCEETLHITVPSNAIPIYLNTIELDELDKVIKYETNENTDYSLPIRVVYTTGISNTVINENTQKVDLTKLSTEYFTKNKIEMNKDGKNKLYTYFYSNYYDGKMNDEETDEKYGNAMVTFAPSLDNRFYIFQKNLTIYQNSSGGNAECEGELKATGGKVDLSNPITDLSQIDPNTTYYFAIDYYVPENGNDGSKGRLVQYAISQKGSDFFGTKGESYLTYYNTKENREVNGKGENVVVATKKGAKRIGNLKYLSNIKENNTTNTADFYYVPSYGNIDELGTYSIVSYLGNNGRLAIPIGLGSADIIKVDEDNNALEGATFGLYAKENIELNGYIFYKAGEEIERKTTDKDGIIEFENLYLGKYEIKEIEPPEGYNLLEEKTSFEVTNENLEHKFTIGNTKKIVEKEPTKEETPKEKTLKGETTKEKIDDTAHSELPKTGATTNWIFLTAIIDFITIIVCYKKYKNLI